MSPNIQCQGISLLNYINMAFSVIFCNIEDVNVSIIIWLEKRNKNYLEVVISTLHRKDDAKESRNSIIKWLLSKKKYCKNAEDSNGFWSLNWQSVWNSSQRLKWEFCLWDLSYTQNKCLLWNSSVRYTWIIFNHSISQINTTAVFIMKIN